VKLNKGAMALCLAFIVAFSLAGLLQKQKEADAAFQVSSQAATAAKLNIRTRYLVLNYPAQHYDFLTFWTAANSQGTLTEKAPLPDNATRAEIYNFINANPGIQFRGICGGLGLSIGVVQFHIAQLQRCGLITSFRRGRYKRFFVAGKLSLREMEAIATMRLNTVRDILKTLLAGKSVTHHDLAVRLKISSQGLTWQINRLHETGLIEEKRSGLNVTYSLKQNCAVMVAETIALVETG
jgi:DNA-binding transcriptional ArsR family regulator